MNLTAEPLLVKCCNFSKSCVFSQCSMTQFSSVAQSCLTLCNPMVWSMPGFPVPYCLPEFAHSCPLNQWCHPIILSSVALFSSCPKFFPASGSFPMSPLFTSGGQSIGASASTSVLPMNIQGWFPLGLTDLAAQGTLKCLLQHHSLKASILWCSAFFNGSTLTSIYLTTRK